MVFLSSGFTIKKYRWIDVIIKGLNAIFYVDAQPSLRISNLSSDLVRITKFVLSEAIKAKKLCSSLGSGDKW